MAAAKYLKVFDIGLQNTFVYRWNFLLRALFNLVPLAGTVFIWRSIFNGRQGEVGGYDYAGMIFYFVMVLLVENLVTPTEDEWQIAADIRDGQINSFLAKPVNYLAYRLSLFSGYRLLYTVVTLPLVAGVFFVFREYATLPHQWMTWPLTVLSVGMAALIQFFLAYSLAMLAFWILEISTVVFIFYSFEYFLSGQLFPLDIMPHWLQGAIKWLPFTYELYFPVSVFLEKTAGTALLHGFLIQAMWVLIMFLVARMMWQRGINHYQSVGG